MSRAGSVPLVETPMPFVTGEKLLRVRCGTSWKGETDRLARGILSSARSRNLCARRTERPWRVAHIFYALAELDCTETTKLWEEWNLYGACFVAGGSGKP